MTPEFEQVFDALKVVLKKHERDFSILTDKPGEYTLVAMNPPNWKKKSPLWVGGVRVGKAYVSFHLMPLYYNPKLVATISPALKKRMQGKTCFNFQKVDSELIAELKTLTQAGIDGWRKAGML